MCVVYVYAVDGTDVEQWNGMNVSIERGIGYPNSCDDTIE